MLSSNDENATFELLWDTSNGTKVTLMAHFLPHVARLPGQLVPGPQWAEEPIPLEETAIGGMEGMQSATSQMASPLLYW